MKNVVVIGANCAWQKVLVFDEFGQNQINRSNAVYRFASGKGINFSRSMKIYGKVEPVLIQFTGGNTGLKIEDDLEQENIKFFNVWLNESSRICTTCLNVKSHETTEIIEPSPHVEDPDIQHFEKLSCEKLDDESCIGLAICGTLVSGADSSLYHRIIKYALHLGKYVLLDSSKEMNEIFELKSNKIILKVNADELRKLTNMSDIVAAMKFLRSTYHFRLIAITNGAENAYLLNSKNELYQYILPPIEPLNPIGSGDTASSVLFSELLKKNSEVESFRMALAAATSNCMSIKCGEFDRNFAQKYAKNIEVIPL